MITTRCSILVPEVPGYTALQREMHDALHAQHPEWIETYGKAPTCDYYESLFAALLVSHRANADAHSDHLLNEIKTERPDDHEFAKNSRVFSAFAPGANRAPQFFSLINQLPGTPLAFDMRMPPRKGISTHETDIWNIARRRSWISDDALDPGSARSTNSVGDIVAEGTGEFL